MEEMTCERHDELASRTQFVTHTIGRVLGAMDLSVRLRFHIVRFCCPCSMQLRPLRIVPTSP